MKTRDVIVGFVFLVVLIAGVLWLVKSRTGKSANLPLPSPSIAEQVNQAFPNIPSGVERANLKDVRGGNSLGVATRTEVVANLPSDHTYQVSLENSSGKIINLGTMWVSKSGWMLQYDSAKYPGYNKVIVSESGNHILEGSF